MDDEKRPPLEFANRVIRQMVDHLFAEALIIQPEDFTALRVVFRHCGGSWFRVLHGSVVDLNLLLKIVAAWGKMPDRKHEPEEVV